MRVEDIPASYKKLIDDAAGVEHSSGGNVMRALAGILAMHDQEQDTPSFRLSAADPAAPAALLTYASMARIEGATTEYVTACQNLAKQFYQWQETHGATPFRSSDGQPDS